MLKAKRLKEKEDEAGHVQEEHKFTEQAGNIRLWSMTLYGWHSEGQMLHSSSNGLQGARRRVQGQLLFQAEYKIISKMIFKLLAF